MVIIKLYIVKIGHFSILHCDLGCSLEYILESAKKSDCDQGRYVVFVNIFLAAILIAFISIQV